MRVALINGSPKIEFSPKIKCSASAVLLEDLNGYLGETTEIVNFRFHSSEISEEVIEELAKTEAWVFAYPLYVDGIPGQLLSSLIQLEEAYIDNPSIRIYGIVNCGFYEGIQTELALKLLQNWCLKAGFIWGGGIGVGAGGALAMMLKMKSGKGPKASVDKALAELANVIIKREVQENKFLSLAIPRFLYKIVAQMGWRKAIKSNGGKVKDLGKIPE